MPHICWTVANFVLLIVYQLLGHNSPSGSIKIQALGIVASMPTIDTRDKALLLLMNGVEMFPLLVGCWELCQLGLGRLE